MADRLVRTILGLTCAAGAIAWPSLLCAQSSQPANAREPISGRRIIKHFDFNERPAGNMGPSPVFWRPVREEGFPPYLQGRFDEQVGRAAAPSFRLGLDGGSIAYQYEGNDIAVRPNSDYLVTAWVRTSGLTTARAYMTAFFLDRKGQRVSNSDRTTALVGGNGGEIDWRRIQVRLAGDVPDARYLGLCLWVSQQRVWDRRPPELRDIEREDVKGTAWFDDITVYRLPRVSLRSSSPGNVFADNEPVILRPEVTDPDGLNLSARLLVTSADGSFRDEQPVRIQAGDVGPQDHRYDHLPVGLYEARLLTSTQDTPLVGRTIHFARLAAPVSPPQSTGGGFGVVLETIDAKALAGQHALLGQLRPERVKLPVWYTQRAVHGEAFEINQMVDGYLQAIVDSGGNPVGIQMDEGRSQQPGGSSSQLRSMIDLMSEGSLAWKPLIAGTWSRYTGLIHVWQLSEDRDETLCLDHRLPGLLPNLHREMASLISEPTVATPVSTRYQTTEAAMGDYRAIYLPYAVGPEDIERHVRPVMGPNPNRAWITLETLENDLGYPREARLADYAERLVHSAFLNAGAVFVFAPWEAQTDFGSAQVSPREEYLVFRTVSDILGHAVPVSRTSLDGQVECLVFDRNGQAILFVRDPYAPAEGREHELYLGEYAEQVDMWGRRTRLPTVGAEQKVRIGRVPSFILNTPTWLVEFRRQFVLTPSLLEANYSARTYDVVFKNTFREPISGSLRIVGPENWDVRPDRLTFVLKPGQVFRQPLEIRFPINAEAGVKALLGQFSIDAERRYQINTPAWFELGLEGIDLETYAFRRGSNAIIRVSMINHTPTPVSFDGDLIVPGRQRLSRLFQNVMPGQSVTKEYALQQAADLAGRHIRVHLNERQGSRVWNRLVTVP